MKEPFKHHVVNEWLFQSRINDYIKNLIKALKQYEGKNIRISSWDYCKVWIICNEIEEIAVVTNNGIEYLTIGGG